MNDASNIVPTSSRDSIVELDDAARMTRRYVASIRVHSPSQPRIVASESLLDPTFSRVRARGDARRVDNGVVRRSSTSHASDSGNGAISVDVRVKIARSGANTDRLGTLLSGVDAMRPRRSRVERGSKRGRYRFIVGAAEMMPQEGDRVAPGRGDAARRVTSRGYRRAARRVSSERVTMVFGYELTADRAWLGVPSVRGREERQVSHEESRRTRRDAISTGTRRRRRRVVRDRDSVAAAKRSVTYKTIEYISVLNHRY